MFASILRPVALAASPQGLTGFSAFLETVKPLVPIPALLFILPIAWLFFKDMWREIDEESLRHRAELVATGKTDPRPMVALVLCALVLAMQEYYGGRAFFEQQFYPALATHFSSELIVTLAKYDELLGFAWWAGTRIGGYTLPFVVWGLAFRRDSLLDFGLRTRGFFKHAWIYGLFLAIVLPLMLLVSAQPDFGSYYPFYKSASRSWFDFLVWEAMYFAQFFALEMFFRGFWLGALRRSFGSGAIFAMAVPYCMIHFGKPYLEAVGAIVAGIALGSLSMKTKSIYQGFLVHITVAALMDWLSLRRRHCTPLTWKMPETTVMCLSEAAERDALAWKIERIVVGVFVVLLLIGLAWLVRLRRQVSAPVAP